MRNNNVKLKYCIVEWQFELICKYVHLQAFHAANELMSKNGNK